MAVGYVDYDKLLHYYPSALPEFGDNGYIKLYRIVCLRDGSYFMNMTFNNKEAAEIFLMEEVRKQEIGCHSLEKLTQFRSIYGLHTYEIMEIE